VILITVGLKYYYLQSTTPYSLVEVSNVSEGHIVSIFRVEVGKKQAPYVPSECL
jgi:hypothetical protein